MLHSLHLIIALVVVVCAVPAEAEKLGRFQGELVYKAVQGKERVVETVAPFSFEDPKGKLWSVPTGATVDGASIPQAFWSVIGGPFTGKYREASVIHDYYCDHRIESWQDTHRVFYDGMRANGVDAVTAYTMYAAVYWGGPRWVDARGSVPSDNTIAGSPAQLASPPIDIVALAAKPDITLAEIRRAIDLALDVGSADSARRALDANKDCSLVVEPLAQDSAAFALCNLDAESQKLLAKRNLRILIGDIDTLLSANDTLLLPKVDDYILRPTPQNWRLIDEASRKVLRLVSLTMISLDQTKQGLGGLGREVETTTYGRPGVGNTLERVGRIGASRSMLLSKNISSTPQDAREMRHWKAVYVELLQRLKAELPGLQTALDAP